MKCPNCGMDMPEQALYCEHCGEDIHIVPDFEPEIDGDIDRIISKIAEKAFEVQTEKPFEKKKSVKIPLIVITAILLLGTLCFVYILRDSRYHSVDYQLSRAEKSVQREDYAEAINSYERALELNQENLEIKFSLAEVYLLQNQKSEYEYLLKSIIYDPKATTEQLTNAYGKLIAIYRANGDYDIIQKLLLTSENETILQIFQDYIVATPELSLPYGYYTSIQPLKITTTGAGKIYYTLDGTDPTEQSIPYKSPILLEDGDYHIKICVINENGVRSEIVGGEYHIEKKDIPTPQISTYSGDYDYPAMIEVEGDASDVYYTTDGSVPNTNSLRYEKPIHMPLGRSVYKFVRIREGNTSQVTECVYHFEIDTEYSYTQAEKDIVHLLMGKGKIWNEIGNFDEIGSMYKYSFQYVIDIAGIGRYYVIAEGISTGEEEPANTGNFYAVNVYSGEIYELQKDGNNQYVLIEIE